jgi:hypothetical protein
MAKNSDEEHIEDDDDDDDDDNEEKEKKIFINHLDSFQGKHMARVSTSWN